MDRINRPIKNIFSKKAFKHTWKKKRKKKKQHLPITIFKTSLIPTRSSDIAIIALYSHLTLLTLTNSWWVVLMNDYKFHHLCTITHWFFQFFFRLVQFVERVLFSNHEHPRIHICDTDAELHNIKQQTMENFHFFFYNTLREHA